MQQLTTEQRHLATLTSTTSIRKLTALEDRTTHRTEQAQVGADAAATATDAAECLDRPARAQGENLDPRTVDELGPERGSRAKDTIAHLSLKD